MPSDIVIKRIVEFASRIDGVDPVAIRDGLDIGTLHRHLEQDIENDLANWGLTARQIEILECLYHRNDDTLTPAELSEEVGLTRSAMTSALDSLEKLGHTARTPHPTDRRMVAVALTPSGRQFIGERLPFRYERLSSIICGLTGDERLFLLKTYKKMREFVLHNIAVKTSK